MKFEMNNRVFEIIEKSQEEIKEYNQYTTDGYYLGQTHYKEREIWLDKDLSFLQKRITLYHELMHVYIFCYITSEETTFTEERLCDISANAHIIINKIVDDYFKDER